MLRSEAGGLLLCLTAWERGRGRLGEVWVVIGIGAFVWWLIAKGSAATATRDNSLPLPPPPTGLSQRQTWADPDHPRAEPWVSPTTPPPNGQQNARTQGFQPIDRCSCGGSWVKRENSDTGGRFFGCSRYPRCKKTREQVLRDRLGSRYSDTYCARGHDKTHFGTVEDPRTGRELCKRCIEKGHIQPLRSRRTDDVDLDPPDTRPMWFGDDSEEIEVPSSSSKKVPHGPTETCRNGHVRTKENTYTRPDGSIECRVCRKNAR